MKIDSVFDSMSFEEKAVYLLNLSINRQTRDQVEGYEKRLPLEQRFKFSQIRFQLYLYMTDKTMHGLYLELAGEADKKAVAGVRSILMLEDTNTAELAALLWDLWRDNEARYSNVLMARDYPKLIKDAETSWSYYIDALGLNYFAESPRAITKLSEVEIESVRSATNIDMLQEVETTNSIAICLEKIKSLLEESDVIAAARYSITEQEMKEEMDKSSEQDKVDELEKLLEKMKRISGYDII